MAAYREEKCCDIMRIVDEQEGLQNEKKRPPEEEKCCVTVT